MHKTSHCSHEAMKPGGWNTFKTYTVQWPLTQHLKYCDFSDVFNVAREVLASLSLETCLLRNMTWLFMWYFDAEEVQISAAALKHIVCPGRSISFTLKCSKTHQEFSHPRTLKTFQRALWINDLNPLEYHCKHSCLILVANNTEYLSSGISACCSLLSKQMILLGCCGKQILHWATSRLSVARSVSYSHSMCCHFLIKSDLISIYCILVFQ